MESRYNHCNPHFSSFSFPRFFLFIFFACQNFWKFGPPPLDRRKILDLRLTFGPGDPPPPFPPPFSIFGPRHAQWLTAVPVLLSF